MADPKLESKDAEIAKLKAELAAAKAAAVAPAPGADVKSIAAALAEVLKPPARYVAKPKKELAPEHKGTKQYIVGPSGHYRDQRIYREGDVVSVTDQAPAKDWKPFEGGPKPKAAVAKPENIGRAADQGVGG